MTTVAVRTTQASPQLSFAGVLRSEVGKLTSLRSTRVAALCVPLLVIAGMLLRAFAYAQTAESIHLDVGSLASWTDVLNVGTEAGTLSAVVLAALAAGSEYTGRVALTTFVAVPRRMLVLAAKIVAVLVPLMALIAIGFGAGAIVSAPFMASAALGGPSLDLVGPALTDLVVVLASALLALAVTTLARSTAAGITVMLAVLLVLPTVLGLVHRAVGVDLAPFLLTYAAPMAAALHDPAGTGALLRDLVVTMAWVIIPTAAAAFALVRRDA